MPRLDISKILKLISDGQTGASSPLSGLNMLGRSLEEVRPGLHEPTKLPLGGTFKIVPQNTPGSILGMRSKGGTGHMLNIPPGQPGFLGNPHKWAGNGGPKGVSVSDVIASFEKDFLAKIDNDPAFKQAILALRGKEVGYYMPNAVNHLQVIQKWLAKQ